jgi:putative ABC transport system permease protein
MHRWLQHFAYRTDISWWIFPLAFSISIMVAGITICWRTYLAAIRNPVEALRYE